MREMVHELDFHREVENLSEAPPKGGWKSRVSGRCAGGSRMRACRWWCPAKCQACLYHRIYVTHLFFYYGYNSNVKT